MSIIQFIACRKTFGTNCADSAESLNLLNEGKFRVFCERDCSVADAPVKGSGIYTSDSSLCRAAIHAGKIDNFVGGKATVKILPGQPAYSGTEKNGISSQNSGAHSASFTLD